VPTGVDGLMSGTTTAYGTIGGPPGALYLYTFNGTCYSPSGIKVDMAEGYFYDSFDYTTLRAGLLEPLGPGGSREFRRRILAFRLCGRLRTGPA
jgi:hypothetical protein